MIKMTSVIKFSFLFILVHLISSVGLSQSTFGVNFGLGGNKLLYKKYMYEGVTANSKMQSVYCANLYYESGNDSSANIRVELGYSSLLNNINIYYPTNLYSDNVYRTYKVNYLDVGANILINLFKREKIDFNLLLGFKGFKVVKSISSGRRTIGVINTYIDSSGVDHQELTYQTDYYYDAEGRDITKLQLASDLGWNISYAINRSFFLTLENKYNYFFDPFSKEIKYANIIQGQILFGVKYKLN